jgi:putative transposase
MKTVRVHRGERVLCGGRVYVILHLVNLDFVIAVDVASGSTDRLMIEHLRPVTDDEVHPRADVGLSSVSDADWMDANRRFEIVRPLLARGARSRERVEERARESGMHWTTLYRWIRAFNAAPSITSLLPTGSDGGRGKGRLDSAVEEVITSVIDSCFLRSQQPSVQDTIREVQLQCRARDLLHPSGSSVRRRINRVSKERVTVRGRGHGESTER